MVLSDYEICMLVHQAKLIQPFEPNKKLAHGMSYGLSCCGYDVRIAETVRLKAKEFRLSVIEEYLRIPPYICVMVKDKSTWARRGLSVFNTIIEPGWKGYLTIELVNNNPDATIHIEKGTPIAQLIFQRIGGEVMNPYNGKYQDQPKEPIPAVYEE